MPDLDPEIRGEAGGGDPDAEIRGLPGLQFFVFLFCFVLFFFFKALRASIWSWAPGLV